MATRKPASVSEAHTIAERLKPELTVLSCPVSQAPNSTRKTGRSVQNTCFFLVETSLGCIEFAPADVAGAHDKKSSQANSPSLKMRGRNHGFSIPSRGHMIANSHFCCSRLPRFPLGDFKPQKLLLVGCFNVQLFVKMWCPWVLHVDKKVVL